MEYKLQDLIDIEQFQALQDRLNEIYSFPSSIIDNDGNILTVTAWQDVCTKFHRANKECEKECIKSDQYILSHLHEANPAVSYRCPQGLVDNATPIIIDGVHYGNFFTGQFFLEKPDLEFFKDQAEKYGFDEEAYLEAVKKVPIWSKEQLDSYLFFIKGLIEVISSSGLKKLKEIEARQKIDETEERASTIINQMLDGFWIVSGENSQVVDVNPAMCDMLGYTREELLTMSISDVEAIDSPEDIEQRIKQIVRDGTASFQSRHRRKNGTLIDVEVSVRYLPSSDMFFAIHRDITERKQAEKILRESEQRSRSIFEQAPIGMGVIDTLTGRFLQVNPKYCEIVGLTKKEMLNLEFNTITHPEDLGIDIEKMQKLIAGEIRSYDLEKRYIRPDQSIVWAHLTIVAMWEAEDSPKHHLTMVEDITERKRTQEELRDSEERFRSLYENATIGIYRTTPEGKILLANPALVNMLGYASFDELAQRNLEQEGCDPDYKRSEFRQQIERDGVVTGLESAWARKDRSTIFVRESAKAIRDTEGKVIHYEGTVEDITERKQAENSLLESEERLKFSQRVAHVGHWAWDTRENHVTWSDEMKRIFGLDPETFDGDLNQVIAQAIHPDDWEKVNASNASVTTEGKPIPLEYRVIRPDQSVRTVWAEAGEQINDNDGNVIKLSGIVQDITERKQAEDALRESEERLQLFIEHAPASLAMFDREMYYLAVSRRWLIDYHLGDQDIIGKSHYDIFPEISDEWKAVHQHCLEGEVVRAEEDKFVRADGSIQWLTWEVRPWHENEGSIGGIVIFTEDITNRKQAEEALRKAETKYHALVEQIPAIIYTDSAEQPEQTLYISPQLRKLTGYEPEEWIADNDLWLKVMHSDDQERVAAEFSRANQTGKPFSAEYRFITRDEKVIWLQDEAYLIRDDEGKPSYWQGVLTDITARKQADLKIQEHLMRLDALRKIDQAISSSFDLNISLNILLSYAIRLLDVDAATVLQLNPELNMLEYKTGLGFKTDAVKKSSVKLGESYAGKVALYQEMIQVQNLADEADNLFTHGFLRYEDFVSYYGVPLVVKGKVIGVLEAFSRSNIERSSEWFDFFNALAGQAAIAMDNLTLFNKLQKSNIELLMAYDDTIEGWSRAMDLRDEETEGHTRRVTDLTINLAERMGINRSELVHVRRGALLHDIGKLGVPDQILHKPGALTDEEWVIMRQHPIHAYEMLKRIAYLQTAIDIPYCHHEKWDGTGYPRGLKGEQIPISARIFAITDVWDALSNKRPYRPAWPTEKTLEYIRSQSGAHFDPDVVEAFLEIVGKG